MLVVDDNATNRRLLEGILTGWGMRPTLVEGGTVALRAMEQARDRGAPFALVLVDYQMPDIDGFEVAARIKGHPDLGTTTIMMLSSVGQRGDAQRCRELGVAGYLTKPVRQSILLDAIRTVLSLPGASTSPTGLVTRHSLRATQAPLRVLLAEDNRVNQLVAASMLRARGHQVIIASDGREAIQALERESVDVVLMDVQMTGMDGIAATEEIRKNEKGTGRHIPIVALTAYARQEDRARCLKAGMDAYLSKPFTSVDLTKTLERLLPTPPVLAPFAEPAVPGTGIFNKSELLTRVESDKALFKQVLQLFLDDCPNLLDGLRESALEGLAKGVAVAAHTLKGALGAVSAHRAAEAAGKVEWLAREGDLSALEPARMALEAEIEALRPVLKAAVSEGT